MEDTNTSIPMILQYTLGHAIGTGDEAMVKSALGTPRHEDATR